MACASFLLLIFISSLFSTNCISYAAATHSLKQGQVLRDWEELISAGGVFRLGFFNPNPTYSIELGSSGPRHLGIWFNRIPFYSVWVANRQAAVPNSSGVLTIDGNGKLKITYQDDSGSGSGSGSVQSIVINPNMVANTPPGGNFTATLLDSGNLVVRQVDSSGIPGPILWQSFDYPHNVFLPGMKLGTNLKTGQNWTLTSWLSKKVPAPGAFRFGLDPSGANQLLIWRRGEVYWSSGLWQNGSFKSAPELTKQRDVYDFRFVANKEERYFSYSVKNESILSNWDLNTIGTIRVFTLEGRLQDSAWIVESVGPCNNSLKNITGVCLSEKPNKCKNGSEFFEAKRGYFDYNDNLSYYDPDMNLSLSDCHSKCWKNCTCVGYQSLLEDDTGCLFWSKGSKFYPSDYADFIYLLNSGKQ